MVEGNTGYSAGDFSDVYAVQISYSANKNLSLQFEQEGLAEAGANYGSKLSAAEGTTITLVLKDFSQPDWVSGDASAQKELDLSVVKALSFSATSESGSTDFEVS